MKSSTSDGPFAHADFYYEVALTGRLSTAFRRTSGRRPVRWAGIRSSIIREMEVCRLPDRDSEFIAVDSLAARGARAPRPPI